MGRYKYVLTDETVKIIEANKGKKYKDIAEIAGCSIGTVCRYFSGNGLTQRATFSDLIKSKPMLPPPTRERPRPEYSNQVDYLAKYGV